MKHKYALPRRTLHRVNPPFSRVLRKHWLLFVMLVPATVYALIFSYIPMTGIVLAFKNYQYKRRHLFFAVGGVCITLSFWYRSRASSAW